jgi:hypothetical protein
VVVVKLKNCPSAEPSAAVIVSTTVVPLITPLSVALLKHGESVEVIVPERTALL